MFFWQTYEILLSKNFEIFFEKYWSESTNGGTSTISGGANWQD